MKEVNGVTTTISRYEVLLGAHYMEQRVDTTTQLFQSLDVLPVDARAASAAAKIGSHQKRQGEPLSDADLLIAGVATSNNIDTIITRDSDFEDTPLQVKLY